MAIDPGELYAEFRARTLPKSAWTHEAHLAVCWQQLQQSSADEALVVLRDAIRDYNDSVGTVNSDSSGYHETITVFYVAAIADLGAADVGDVLDSPIAERSAPLEHWSPERLFSVEARRRWVAPDLRPLPFAVPVAPETGRAASSAP